MDPFQVVDIRTSTVNRVAGRRLFVDLTLATFEIGTTTMQIPQFTLYYFRKDSKTVGPEQAVAESLTIPETPVDFRSTLPPNPTDLRDAVTVNSWDRNRWVLPVAGWTCAGILLCGSGWNWRCF
jgi:hypothetical protein